MAKSLRIHAEIARSRVNGPGERYTIWTQGCQKACSGCFNPNTWSRHSGTDWDPQALAKKVLESGATGVTLTGGDPLEQPEAILEFLKALHPGGELHPQLAVPEGGILCFTGYTKAEVEEIGGDAAACLGYLDLLIDGRYVEALRYGKGLAGSANQQFHFSSAPGRGRAILGEGVVGVDQEVEIHGGCDESISITGFPDMDRNMKKRLKVLGVDVLG